MVAVVGSLCASLVGPFGVGVGRITMDMLFSFCVAVQRETSDQFA